MSSDAWTPEKGAAMKALQELVRVHEELSLEKAALRQPEFERAMLELMGRLKAAMSADGLSR